MRNATEIVMVLDKSGSMQRLKEDAIGGFNKFVEEQKAEPEEATLRLVQFDTNYFVGPVFPLPSVPALTAASYKPGGWTALLDALGRTILETGRRLAAMPETSRPDKVIVVTITDGEENSSHEFSLTQVRDMITHQQDRYSWKFIFLGANQDAFAEARKLGMNQDLVARYVQSDEGIAAAYRGSSKAVRELRKRGVISPEWKADIN